MVKWNFQREAAEYAVGQIVGVVSVQNFIVLRRNFGHAGEGEDQALQRQAARDAHSIRVDNVGGRVTLTGHAPSWPLVEEAANAAWATPGVTEVVDQLKVQMSP